MYKRLLILAGASFFLLAPVAHLQLAATEKVVVKQEVVMSDSDITAAVKKVISSDMNFSKFKIDVATDKGIVTLSGNVDSLKAKLDLESKAKAVPGVIKVINNIEVKA